MEAGVGRRGEGARLTLYAYASLPALHWPAHATVLGAGHGKREGPARGEVCVYEGEFQAQQQPLKAPTLSRGFYPVHLLLSVGRIAARGPASTF